MHFNSLLHWIHYSIKAYHVVPQSLGQLLVSLYSEVETVVSEEAHIDLSILPGDKTASVGLQMEHVAGEMWLMLTKPNATDVTLRIPMTQTLLCKVSHWFILWKQMVMLRWYITVAFGERTVYREAWRVCVLQEGLKDNSKVLSEEAVSVEQILKPFLCTDITQLKKKKWSTVVEL